MWRRSQAAENIYLLTVVFTSLVVIAATQGKENLTPSWQALVLIYIFLDIAVDGELSYECLPIRFRC